MNGVVQPPSVHSFPKTDLLCYSMSQVKWPYDFTGCLAPPTRTMGGLTPFSGWEQTDARQNGGMTKNTPKNARSGLEKPKLWPFFRLVSSRIPQMNEDPVPRPTYCVEVFTSLHSDPERRSGALFWSWQKGEKRVTWTPGRYACNWSPTHPHRPSHLLNGMVWNSCRKRCGEGIPKAVLTEVVRLVEFEGSFRITSAGPPWAPA